MLMAQLSGQPMFGGTPTAVGGYVGVKALQEQLRRIAFEFSKPSVDPAVYDGTITLGTIVALANAAPIVGEKLHVGVGQAIDVIKLIKSPIEKLPYGSTIINFVLSPWIVDKIFGVILSIIKLVPGGGGTASAIDSGVKVALTAIANAASPIAAGLLTVKASQGFSASGYCWVLPTSTMPGRWERMRAGQATCENAPPASAPTIPVIRDWRRDEAAAGPRTVRTGLAPSPPGNFQGIVRDRRAWIQGKAIVPSEWGRTRTYDGLAPFENLAVQDQETWRANRTVGPFTKIFIPSSFNFGISAANLQRLTVEHGAIAFMTFRGFDGTYMGAFWDVSTSRLRILPVPEPASSKYPWDYAVDAVSMVVGAVGSAGGAIGNAIGDIAQSAWNWIAQNADDVYRAIQKYGCAIVNNDIVVGIAATGTGIVASPAASAAVVSAVGTGKAACAAFEVAEALYAIYQLLAMDLPAQPPLSSPTPPSVLLPVEFMNLSLQFPVPKSPPIVPLAKLRYPVGSIAAYDPKLGRYRIAIPIGTQLNVLSGTGADGFGVAASHFEVDVLDRVPPTVILGPLVTYQKQTATLPVYKRASFWIVVGGTVVAAGSGYALYRRRRRLTR